jgi:Protein of unknown function (DUF2924)
MLRRPEGATVDEGGSRDRLAALHRARRLLGNPEEKARAHARLIQRGTRLGLPYRRTSERMRSVINDASARQHSGEPSPVPGRGGGRNHRSRKLDVAEVEREITGLLDGSTDELRLAWREFHRVGPPLGLSRDLMIRALAYELQERAHGGPRLALKRRLQTLTGALEKGALTVDPGILLKAGTTLVRQWRGHAHTVRVRDDGSEYQGERYRSLSMIAERITGAHWSGPRFFGLTKRQCYTLRTRPLYVVQRVPAAMGPASAASRAPLLSHLGSFNLSWTCDCRYLIPT